MSDGWMPMFFGSRVWQSSCMVFTAAAGSRRRRKKKVPVRRREHGQLALIDRVGVHDDQAPLRLPENFRQTDGLYHAAADEVGKHVSRADRRQLIRVADQQQAAAGLERL